MSKKNRVYVGVVDTNGLDCFDLMSPESSMKAQIRATSNKHRHSCLFLAEFPPYSNPRQAFQHCKDTWEMWEFIKAFSVELKCAPEDVKTIENLKELAKMHEALT